MKIECIAIDDEPLALEVVEKYCKKLPYLQLLGSFSNTIEATSFLKEHKVKLIFLDIKMPDINGFEFAETLKKEIKIIFITAYSDYAVKAFEINAFDYLMKPIVFNRFEISCKKIFEYFSNEKKMNFHSESILIKSGNQIVKLYVNEIYFVESNDDYVIFHIVGKKAVQSKMTMKTVAELFKKLNFYRIHRSYLVQLNMIDSITSNTVKINNRDLPISQSYKSSFWTTYHEGNTY